jgi:hypothetical protein
MSINYTTTLVNITPYNVNVNDQVIFSNVGGSSSIILPALVGGGNAGKSFYIKDFSGNSKANPITITAPGKTIDGAAFAILNNKFSHVFITYDGTNWKTIA